MITRRMLRSLRFNRNIPGMQNKPGMAVVSAAAAARSGRFVVVVDEDIDLTNLKEVL
jgi:UbiD family decarboxylase